MSSTTWSTVNKVGLVLQFVYGLVNLPTAFMEPEMEATTSGAATEGPPAWVLWADTILAVILVVAVVLAWVQANRTAAGLASVSNILISLSAVPAFFVDGVPEQFKVLAAIGIVWTIVSVVLTHLKPKANTA